LKTETPDGSVWVVEAWILHLIETKKSADSSGVIGVGGCFGRVGREDPFAHTEIGKAPLRSAKKARRERKHFRGRGKNGKGKKKEKRIRNRPQVRSISGIAAKKKSREIEGRSGKGKPLATRKEKSKNKKEMGRRKSPAKLRVRRESRIWTPGRERNSFENLEKGQRGGKRGGGHRPYRRGKDERLSRGKKRKRERYVVEKINVLQWEKDLCLRSVCEGASSIAGRGLQAS